MIHTGKTTSAASWGVALADAGYNTLIISTDPAHSLGDALNRTLTGNVPIQLKLDGPNEDGGSVNARSGQLWALEVNSSHAAQALVSVIASELNDRQNNSSGSTGFNVSDSSESSSQYSVLGLFQKMLGRSADKHGTGNCNKSNAPATNIANLLESVLGEGSNLLDTCLASVRNEMIEFLKESTHPPPGSDELASLLKIMDYMEEGVSTGEHMQNIRFDRIVLDTAPTGHTLRMLELPEFFLDLIRKFRSVFRSPLSALTTASAGFETSSNSSTDEGTALNVDPLSQIEERLVRLRDTLKNSAETEFHVVTIPTAMAFAETKRLMSALHAGKFHVNKVIINNVIPSKEGFTNRGKFILQHCQSNGISLDKLFGYDVAARLAMPTVNDDFHPDSDVNNKLAFQLGNLAYLDNIRSIQRPFIASIHEIVAQSCSTTKTPLIEVPDLCGTADDPTNTLNQIENHLFPVSITSRMDT